VHFPELLGLFMSLSVSLVPQAATWLALPLVCFSLLFLAYLYLTTVITFLMPQHFTVTDGTAHHC